MNSFLPSCRQHAITRANVSPDLCHHLASPRLKWFKLDSSHTTSKVSVRVVTIGWDIDPTPQHQANYLNQSSPNMSAPFTLEHLYLRWLHHRDDRRCPVSKLSQPCYLHSGLIEGLHPGNERRRYFVTTSLIGWAQTYNQPCNSSETIILLC